MTAPRKIKTDKERAQEELDVYTRRVNAARGRLLDAQAAMEGAMAEHTRCVQIRDHLAAHPALAQDELPLDPTVQVSDAEDTSVPAEVK